MLLTILAQQSATEQIDSAFERAWPYIEQYGIPALTVLLILFAAFVAAGWVSRLVLRSCEKVRLEATLAKFFAKLARWAVLLVAGLFCLSKFGIETASFAVVLGAAGLAIGLAFQGTLSNFAAGIMLLIFRPFKVGDFVSVAGQGGTVFEIELFSTHLDTPDNRRLILPNSSVFGATIENVTYHPRRRVEVSVGVDYGADLDATRRVLEEAAKSVPGALTDPAPQVLLMGLGASSVDWVVRVWATTPEFWQVRDATTRAVKMALDTNGLTIPFPQMDVHFDPGVLTDPRP